MSIVEYVKIPIAPTSRTTTQQLNAYSEGNFMVKSKLFLATLVLAATSSPAFADGNIDVHGGASRSCAEGICSSTNATYGVDLGYDFDASKAIFLGGQVQVDGNRFLGSTHASYAAVARLGTKLGAADSVYALGGYAAQELGSGSGSAGGWRLGAGYEHRIDQTMFVKIEYRYSNYTKYGFSGGQNTGLIGFGAHF